MKNITLNAGGLIGAIGGGAATAGIFAASGANAELVAKAFVGAVVVGAFAGNYLWSAAFPASGASESIPSDLDDPLFGTLSFCSPELWQSPDRKGAWFPPAENRIGVTVHGDRAGPSASARSMFTELIARYSQLSDSIATQLREEYLVAHASGRSASTEDILKPFRLVSIGITPAKFTNQLEIILTYCPEWRRELNIDVTIRNWQAVSAVGYD